MLPKFYKFGGCNEVLRQHSFLQGISQQEQGNYYTLSFLLVRVAHKFLMSNVATAQFNTWESNLLIPVLGFLSCLYFCTHTPAGILSETLLLMKAKLEKYPSQETAEVTKHTSIKYYASMMLIHIHGTDFWTRSKTIWKTEWAMVQWALTTLHGLWAVWTLVHSLLFKNYLKNVMFWFSK